MGWAPGWVPNGYPLRSLLIYGASRVRSISSVAVRWSIRGSVEEGVSRRECQGESVGERVSGGEGVSRREVEKNVRKEGMEEGVETA